MVRRSVSAVLFVAVGLAVGCSQNGGPAGGHGKGGGKTDPAAAAEGKKYLLEVEPAGARGVLETRKQAKDGDEVVMVGRIAGSAKPFVEGRASFSVTDLSIKPCPDGEGCPTPWDCCCVPREELLPAMAQVRFASGDGKTLGVGAKDLLGLKELSVVVVKGKASRDEKGNLSVVADGLHVRKGKG
jgi:hypothetical protein